MIVAAIGESDSGKTFTIEYLTSNFHSIGFMVGCIKHIHHKGFSIDKNGTNTWRYANAGANVIVAISPEEIDIIKKTPKELVDFDKIIKLVEQENLDIVFLEGFRNIVSKRADVLKIVTAKNTAALDQTLKGIAQPIIAIAGLVAKKENEESYAGIPLVRVPEDGQKIITTIKQQLEIRQTKNFV